MNDLNDTDLDSMISAEAQKFYDFAVKHDVRFILLTHRKGAKQNLSVSHFKEDSYQHMIGLTSGRSGGKVTIQGFCTLLARII